MPPSRRRFRPSRCRGGLDDQRVRLPPAAAAAADRVSRLHDLTDREREVLDVIAQGLSNAQIAAALTISEATAKTHVSRVLAKLGCTSRVQAAILAREAGG